ncbi:MAG TPA: FAD-dependent oxidoreductase [Candidatus Angelobacter sp.]
MRSIGQKAASKDQPETAGAGTDGKKRIVIVGGGFAGVTLAQRLEKLTGNETEIVLLSGVNHLVFSPLLAEAVGREISPLHVIVPGRQMVRRTQWLTARATEVDWSTNQVHYVSAGGEHGALFFDHLVIACGSVVDLSAVPGLAAYAYPLKTLGDATFLGNDLIGRLEEAAVTSDPEERQRLLTVVVIGGGFSGVEVAGVINDLMARAQRFYPQLSRDSVRIVLLQRGDRILPELHAESLSQFAFEKLRARGIDVRLQASAVEVSAGSVLLEGSKRIETETIVCTVGNATNPFVKALGLPMERGRLKTGPDMRVAGCSNVWAIGDSACVPNAWDGKPSPPTAQFATRQAKQLAANLARVLKNEETRPFSFHPLGMMASIGHRNAVAEIFGLRLSGLPAWFLWRGAYLAKMPTFLRKVEVAIDWAWSTFFRPNITQLQMTRTERLSRAHYAAGEFVFRKGERGEQFYVIERGSAGVYLDPNLPAVATLGPGEHFGEGAALAPGGQGRRSASVKAETALDLVTLRRDDFRLLTENLGALNKAVQRSLAAGRSYTGFMDALQNEPRLRYCRVADLMSAPAEVLSINTTLERAVDRFHGGKPGYPVADNDGALVGYCGRTELYDGMRARVGPDAPLERFMRVNPPSITATQPLSDAIALMLREQVEVLPVIAEDGSRRIAGVLSPLDIFRRAIALRRPKLAASA